MVISKKLIPFIIFLLCCAILIGQHYYVTARRASFEADRTRYISDILRITEGVSPVLWIDPQYSYISDAKYFDLSGNENHGTQDNVDYQPTVAPPGLDFDGDDDYVDCGDGIQSITDAITIEAWVKPASLANKYVISQRGSWRLGFGAYGTAVDGIFTTSSGNLIPHTAISQDVWSHVVLTYDKSITTDAAKIFVNGVLKDTEDGVGDSLSSSSYPLTFGARGPDWGYHNGIIDEVRIYNRALSATQIQQLYLLGLSRHRQ